MLFSRQLQFYSSVSLFLQVGEAVTLAGPVGARGTKNEKDIGSKSTGKCSQVHRFPLWLSVHSQELDAMILVAPSGRSVIFSVVLAAHGHGAAIRLGVRNNVFSIRVVMQQHSCTGGVGSPTLEVFQSYGDVVSGHGGLGWGWTG